MTDPTTAITIILGHETPYREAKRRIVEAFERRYFADLIAQTEGNLSAASRKAQLSRRYIRSLLRRYDLYTPPTNDVPGRQIDEEEGPWLSETL